MWKKRRHDDSAYHNLSIANTRFCSSRFSFNDHTQIGSSQFFPQMNPIVILSSYPRLDKVWISMAVLSLDSRCATAGDWWGCDLMWAALRSRALYLSSLKSSSFPAVLQRWKLGVLGSNRFLCSSLAEREINKELLNLEEVQKVLTDVKADNVQVVHVRHHCDWTDFMVFVTGRSAWHVRNIAQALIYQVKQKQRGTERMLLPSVEGEKEGKWIVIDSGSIIVHALDEKARAYYNLERLWTTELSSKEHTQELEKAFAKVRRKNNSKKPAQRNA
ncbi:hypothetical protein U1Q18_047981 [Sarracenia purpurea var. burkii]